MLQLSFQHKVSKEIRWTHTELSTLVKNRQTKTHTMHVMIQITNHRNKNKNPKQKSEIHVDLKDSNTAVYVDLGEVRPSGRRRSFEPTDLSIHG